jgi:hypothetical protein
MASDGRHLPFICRIKHGAAIILGIKSDQQAEQNPPVQPNISAATRN